MNEYDEFEVFWHQHGADIQELTEPAAIAWSVIRRLKNRLKYNEAYILRKQAEAVYQLLASLYGDFPSEPTTNRILDAMRLRFDSLTQQADDLEQSK